MVELGGTLPLAGQPIDWVHAMLRWIPIAELMPQLEMPIDGQRLVLMAERFIKEMLLGSLYISTNFTHSTHVLIVFLIT
jgi:hypothetical protein